MKQCFIDDTEEYTSWAFTRSHLRTARTVHSCTECGRLIVPGRSYEFFCGRADHIFWTYRTCSVCLEIRESFFCRWIYGEIWDRLRETDIPADGMPDLSAKAIAKMEEMLS